MEWLTRGWYGVRDLYARFWVRGVALRWYLLAGLLPVGIGLGEMMITSQPLGISIIPLLLLSLTKGLLYTPVAAFEYGLSQKPRLLSGV